MDQQHATVKSQEWATWDERRRPADAVPPRPSTAPLSPPEIEAPARTRPSTAPVHRGGTEEPAHPGSSTARSLPHPRAAAAPPAAVAPAQPTPEGLAALEAIRRRFADAWGTVGPDWGVAPATARVHGYLLARRSPLTEWEIRRALGLSHRATSLALSESEAWGLVERVAEPRRVGRRGPAGTAWVALGDHWRWFGRVVEQRRMREGDPAVAAIAAATAAAERAARDLPADVELADLRDWLADFLSFVRTFDRAASIVSRVPPGTLERGMRLLGDIPDEEVLRLLTLLDSVPDEDVRGLLRVVSALPTAAAARAARLVARALQPLVR